jgi:integrase
MMRRKLTDRFVSTAKMPSKGIVDTTDTAAHGLTLRLMAPSTKHPDGFKSWAVRYRVKGGAQKRATIGAYPALSLSKARQRAMVITAAAKGGVDLPEEEAKHHRRDTAAARTVGHLLTEYVEAYCKPNQRRWRLTERLFETHVRPHLGGRRLVDLRRQDGAELMDRLQKAGLRAQVNRVRSQLVAALNWAVESRGYLETNPLASVKRRKGLERERGRVLSDAELRAIWRAAARIGGSAGAFVQMLALTGQRRDEVRCMVEGEIVLGTADWVLPAARNKGKRDHLVPLSDAAAAIVAERVSANPGRRHDRRPIFTLSGKKPYAGHKRLKGALDRESGVKNWTYHDLRRTCASGMAALHVAQDTIDRVLNHAAGKLARTYNVHEYRAEKAEALQRWADHVTGIVSAESGKVVHLDRVKV